MVSICWLGISSSDQKLENLAAEQMSDRGVKSEIAVTLLYLIYQHCFLIKVIPFTNSTFLSTPTTSEMHAVGYLLTCCLGLHWLLTASLYFWPNLWPCSSYLSTGNAEKSQRVISALQGGYFTGVPPVSADIDVTTCAVCGSAPSWGRTHWFTKHSNFFLHSELCSTKQVLVSLHTTSYLQFPFGVPSAEE